LNDIRKSFGSGQEDIVGDVMDSGADDAEGDAREDVGVVTLTGLKSLAVHFKGREWRSVDNNLYASVFKRNDNN